MIKIQQIKFLAFIVIISTIGQMSAEVYVPSLPYIAQEFHVTHGLVQLSISYFLFGMAITSIYFGYISDYIGRRKVLVWSSVISTIGTLICCIAPNIYYLIAGRLCQGIGFAGVSAMGTAILRDKFQGMEYAKYMSYLGIAFALSIDIAPFIGGFLQEWFGWRIIFALIVGYNLLVIYMSVQYRENQHNFKNKVLWHELIVKMVILSKNKEFVVYSLVNAIIYAVFMAYIAVATFIVQTHLGKSPVWFGTLTLYLSILFGVFAFINGKLLNYLSLRSATILGFILVFISALMLLGFSLVVLNINTFIISIIPMIIGSSFVFANSSALSFDSIHDNIGIASAIGNTVRLIAGFVVVFILSMFSSTTAVPLGWTLAILSIMAFILMYLVSVKQVS